MLICVRWCSFFIATKSMDSERFLLPRPAGQIYQPKWGHLKELHEVLYLVEAALFASDAEPENFWFGPNLEVLVLLLSSAFHSH